MAYVRLCLNNWPIEFLVGARRFFLASLQLNFVWEKKERKSLGSLSSPTKRQEITWIALYIFLCFQARSKSKTTGGPRRAWGEEAGFSPQSPRFSYSLVTPLPTLTVNTLVHLSRTWFTPELVACEQAPMKGV